ncbi:MAG: lactonase family protein, partial [Tannerella sp.]|nr:lactonase family protein [Tannerella sp.]
MKYIYLILCLLICHLGVSRSHGGMGNNLATHEITMLVGTYTNGGSEGIYAYRFDIDDLRADLLGQAATDNPSYLAISKDGKFVYAVNESGNEKSAVSAFAFDKATGAL